MAVMQRVVKPRSQRAKRALEAREPKAVEDRKRSVLIRGHTCSQRVLQVMRDLHTLRRPDSAVMSRKHPDLSLPFEDQAVSLEKLAGKEDAALFAFGSHSKKRPDNLVLGCMFDGHLLDMHELGVANFKALAEFKNEKVRKLLFYAQ